MKDPHIRGAKFEELREAPSSNGGIYLGFEIILSPKLSVKLSTVNSPLSGIPLYVRSHPGTGYEEKGLCIIPRRGLFLTHTPMRQVIW